MKIPKRQLAWAYSVIVILFLSGIAWMWLHFFGRQENSFEDNVYVYKSRALKIHGAAAMAFLVVFGVLIPTHMQKNWQGKINRLSGSIFVGVNLILIVTGYGLYYFGGEACREMAHWIHIALGIAFPGFLLWHILTGISSSEAKTRKRS